MRMGTESQPFCELPAALVEEVIAQAKGAGTQLLSTFQHLRDERLQLRKALEVKELIQHESRYGCPPVPTTCGVDGSYAVERLLTADFAAAAAVAVEGLTPPSETRHWIAPHHSTFVAVETHHELTGTVLRAVMLGRELLLASQAPHDLVVLDSTLTLPVIYLNQSLNALGAAGTLSCGREFRAHAIEYATAYLTILESARTDKNYAALPKYSTRREIGSLAGWSREHDDRALLTLLLNPGELSKPMVMEESSSPWHINLQAIGTANGPGANLVAAIVAAISKIHVFYYKPQPWLPALRVEVANSIAANSHRMAVVLQGLKHQCAAGSMLEPYPQFLADRMVKSLSRAIPAFRQVATQQIAESYGGDISEVYFSMHGYRTESGR